MKCSQFAIQAIRKSKKDQLTLMAKCMSQDCMQSMEPEVNCQYVTPGPGFCYTNPGQLFCKENPSSPSCVENFKAGGEWTPVKNFPFVGESPKAAGIKFSGTWRCVCAKGCAYQKSINALRCAGNKKFVGGRKGSAFSTLNPKKGSGKKGSRNGIISSSSKKDQCACVCGKGSEWKEN